MAKKISKVVKRTFEIEDQVKIQVNSKTWVYVKPNLTEEEIELVKAKYNKHLAVRV